MMIEIRNISKTYRIAGNPFYALNDVSLKIEQGDMIAIQGRSGAGKSTLLHVLGCLDTFDSGSYLLDGIDIGKQSPSELARIRNAKIGFVLQDFSLINHKTALYNVEAPMFFNDTPFFTMKDRARTALARTGVADQADKKAVDMSGGQRQRVAIARAIVNNPPIILADEPTGNLDSSTAAGIMDIFRQLNETGITIVIVTHDDVVASYCKRKVLLADGRIVNREAV